MISLRLLQLLFDASLHLDRWLMRGLCSPVAIITAPHPHRLCCWHVHRMLQLSPCHPDVHPRDAMPSSQSDTTGLQTPQHRRGARPAAATTAPCNHARAAPFCQVAVYFCLRSDSSSVPGSAESGGPLFLGCWPEPLQLSAGHVDPPCWAVWHRRSGIKLESKADTCS